ncbi:ATP-binding cassette domain-containing protein [Streptomyces sp. NPDC057280]|uniref:ATP-binding cassette domain-containing protein n=1 Tax=Streptomyces sp. NPDC057280 TaxID=3346081 RepID=UPI003634BDE6
MRPCTPPARRPAPRRCAGPALRPEHPADQRVVRRQQQLSGGQWQRLVLTRASHRQTALLVLDEPTVALYAGADHRIFAGLRELAKGGANLLITHRLTNVAVAHRLVVLNEGRIIQEGTYAQLPQQPGLFRTLCELQRRMSGDTR